jgi:hypothetical protein
MARAQGGDETPPAPLTLTDPGALPFSDTELQQALLARLLPSPGEPGPASARIAAAGPGAVSVRVGDQTRVVVVGDRTGTAAARVVALVIAELMTAAQSASGAPASGPVVPLQQSAAIPPAARIDSGPAAIVRRRSLRLSIAGGLSDGVGSDELTAATLDSDLVIPWRDTRWRLSPSAGLKVMPTRNAGTFDEVSFVSVVARLLGGATWGPIDLFAGPFVSAYAIGGATAHRGILFGGEAMARVVAPLSGSLRLAVETRVDGYANRVRALWLGGGAYATPRVGLGIGLGLAWEWAS